LSALEQQLAMRPWQQARPEVHVKLLPQDGDLYVFVQSEARIGKERSMRRRKLKWLWARPKDLQRQRPTYERLLMKIGAAQKEVGRVASLVNLILPDVPPMQERSRRVSFGFTLARAQLRGVRRREGRYLLRTNLTATDPAQLWQFYLQLVEVEAAFKDLKSELAVRPIFHQREDRIEAHIFVAFLAYCVHVTFKHQLKTHAPGLTVRQALEKLAAMQLLDVHFPTTDGRELLFTRYTEPERDQQLLLAKLGWTLPPQSAPRITAAKMAAQMQDRPMTPPPWKTKHLRSRTCPSSESQANVQDGTVIHTDGGFPTEIGKNVSIGHRVLLHSCHVTDDSLIAIGAMVLDRARIGRSCVIAAGALVPPDKDIADGSVVMGGARACYTRGCRSRPCDDQAGSGALSGHAKEVPAQFESRSTQLGYYLTSARAWDGVSQHRGILLGKLHRVESTGA
jgi:carbonic anhydrase/acetyltransferase-like protein (isoleucine patch superfamily)